MLPWDLVRAKRKLTVLCLCCGCAFLLFFFVIPFGEQSATVKNVRQKPWNSNYFSQFFAVKYLSFAVSFCSSSVFCIFLPKKNNMKNLRICKYQLAFVYLFKASCKNWNKWKRTNFNRTCKMSCRLYLHYGERIYFQRVSAMAQYINSLCQQLPHVRCQIHEISIRFAAQIYLLKWISFTLCLCVRFTSQFVLFN